LNNKLKVKGIFYDIEKAFDFVNHNILLHKMEIYGITGIPKKLFTHYLKDRYQRVSLKDNAILPNVESKWSKTLDGVPQGSVLGPLWLLLYINDLPFATDESAMPILFAVDTSLIIVDKILDIFDTKLSTNIKILDHWFKSNLLSINFSKTYRMHFSTSNSNTAAIKAIISCNSNEIMEV
jgi:hypothetical protein